MIKLLKLIFTQIFTFLGLRTKKYNNNDLEQLSLFGTWQSPTGPRLILEKQASGILACKKCRGYGTYGNPLCGALYTCDKCEGSGNRFKCTIKKLPLDIIRVYG